MALVMAIVTSGLTIDDACDYADYDVCSDDDDAGYDDDRHSDMMCG